MSYQRIALAVAAALVVTVAGVKSYAAPQILGLLASAEPIQMNCQDGTCVAEVSSFCMQPHRSNPGDNVAYRAAAAGDLSLVFAGPDGERIEVPARKFANIVTARSFSAIRVSLPAAVLKQLGSTRVLLKVGKRASVVPVAEANDPKPLSAAEIAYVTGPFRNAVAEAHKKSGDRAEMVELTNRLINALGANYRYQTPARRAAVWDEVVGRKAAPGSAARDWLKQNFDACRRYAADGYGDPLAICLQQFHDTAGMEFTAKAWKLYRGGS